jgi:hypothetical protein
MTGYNFGGPRSVLQRGTSLSVKVRELLLQYVNGSDDVSKRQQQEATASLMGVIEIATQTTQAAARSLVSRLAFRRMGC